MYLLGLGTIALTLLCAWLERRLVFPIAGRHMLMFGNSPWKPRVVVLLTGFAAFILYGDHIGQVQLPLVAFFLTPLLMISGLVMALSRQASSPSQVTPQTLQVLMCLAFLFMLIASFDRPGVLSFLGAAALLLTAVVSSLGVIAWVLESLALAVLGMLSGLALPLLAAFEPRSVLVLLALYVMTQLGIALFAHSRRWPPSHQLGFVVACNAGIAWGMLVNVPERLIAAEFILAAAMLCHMLALRRQSAAHDRPTGAYLLLAIGTGLQCIPLLWWWRPVITIAMVSAVIYLGLTWRAHRHPQVDEARPGWAVMTAIFTGVIACLTLPASLSSCACAVAGAAAVWLGWREQSRPLRGVGLLLQALAGGALVRAFDTSNLYYRVPVALNIAFLCALALVVSSLLLCCWQYQKQADTWPKALRVATTLYLCSLFVWLTGTLLEINRVYAGHDELVALWLLLVVTTCLATEFMRNLPVTLLARTIAFSTLLLSSAGPLVLFLCYIHGWQPLQGRLLGVVAAMAMLGWHTLSGFRAYGRLAVAMQSLWWCNWALIAGVAVLVALKDSLWLSDDWRQLLALIPAISLWFVLMRRPQWLAEPLPGSAARTRTLLMRLLTVAMSCAFVYGLVEKGDPAPLPYMPLLNPLEVLLVTILAGTTIALSEDAMPPRVQRARSILLALAALALLDSTCLRGIQQFTGVPWMAVELMRSGLAQGAIMFTWMVFGLVLWSRQRHQRMQEPHHAR